MLVYQRVFHPTYPKDPCMVYLPTIAWCIMVNVYRPYMDGMGYKLVIYTAHCVGTTPCQAESENSLSVCTCLGFRKPRSNPSGLMVQKEFSQNDQVRYITYLQIGADSIQFMRVVTGYFFSFKVILDLGSIMG